MVGRNPACAVKLDGRTVSWQHAEVRCSAKGEAVIRDLGSTNGLFVNGEHLMEAVLEPGSLIRIGSYLGLVTRERPMHGGADFPHAGGLGLHVGRALGAALAPLRSAEGATPLVILGETGTGKTVAARLLHAESGRRGACVEVDCGGADAAARLTRPDGEIGPAFTEARDGTLVLRNVDALPPAAQGLLAAALESAAGAAVHRVATTQEPLDVSVAEGRLSRALRSRLAGVTVELPPLRRRVAEIPALFQRLLDGRTGMRPRTVSPELIERLCLYDWPCNVREMVLVVERLLDLYGDEERLRAAHLPARMQAQVRDSNSTTSPVTPLPRMEVSKLLEAVRDAHGSLARAASRLGISRERAYRLMEGIGPQSGHAEG
jgi:DNA-binding NtrC family response regulator